MSKPLPKYTSPHLNLPDDIEWNTFNAVCHVLQNDPTFGPVINTFLRWDGSIIDTLGPSYADCPFCSVGPFPSESAWITELQHLGPLAFRITLAVKGTNARSLLNLWAAMRRAIFPQNNPAQRDKVISQLTAVGVLKPTILLNAYGLSPEDADGARMLIAEGTIKFAIFIPS